MKTPTRQQDEGAPVVPPALRQPVYLPWSGDQAGLISAL